MSFRLVPLALLLPLGACGQKNDGAPTNAATPDNGFATRMATLNEGERNGVLFRAIRDAGRACQGVTRSQAVDPIGGRPAWVATCEDGTPWVVAIGNDGVAHVAAVRPSEGKAG